MVDGTAVGWASLTRWSERPAYGDAAETAFYVHSKYRSRGIGRKLLEAMVEEARRLRYHTLIARVTGGSGESIHLHEGAGFAHVGTLSEVGRKFDRLLTVHLMQKMLAEGETTSGLTTDRNQRKNEVEGRKLI